MFSQRMVYNWRIPAYGRVPIMADTTLAYVSGEVPRLVVRAGSDAFDIWEGQCLPVNGNVAYLCNPYCREIFVNVAFGLREQLTSTPAEAYNGRYYPKTHMLGKWNGGARSDTLRFGFGIMTAKTRIEFYPNLGTTGAYKLTCVAGASAGFLQTKPATFMTLSGFVCDGLGKRFDSDFTCIAGQYLDSDVSAWVTASGYSGAITETAFDPMNSAIRHIVEPGTAVFVSRSPGTTSNYDFYGQMIIRELGMLAEEFD